MTIKFNEDCSSIVISDAGNEMPSRYHAICVVQDKLYARLYLDDVEVDRRLATWKGRAAE